VISRVVRSSPDAVFLDNNQLVLEFKAQTTAIPGVGPVADPLALGIVSSLARPGGKITGEDPDAGLAMWGKRLGLLKEAIPTLFRVGLLIVPDSLGQRGTAVLKEAAEKIGLSLVDSGLASPLDDAAYRRAFATMVQGGAEAVYVPTQAQHVTNRRVIVELAEQHRLPAIFGNPVYVELGGLMAYSPDWAEFFRHGAQQIDQILKGTMPGDIPFYQGRKFELMINLKTAKALGIEIPNSILAQADEVIE
jgi:putative ABC transport system substrate-binding protein